jgi:hypothetical protein
MSTLVVPLRSCPPPPLPLRPVRRMSAAHESAAAAAASHLQESAVAPPYGIAAPLPSTPAAEERSS